jgi:hypothetical protein
VLAAPAESQPRTAAAAAEPKSTAVPSAISPAAEEARQLISAWMNYLPGVAWDDRLGGRSGAGRRK